jgi:hypothetical protein
MLKPNSQVAPRQPFSEISTTSNDEGCISQEKISRFDLSEMSSLL